MWIRLRKENYYKALEYLQKHSPFTCPMYGNVASAGFTYKAFAMRSGVFFIYKDDNSIQGIAAGFNDGNVMVHTSSKEAEDTVLDTILTFPFHSVWGLSGKLPPSTVISDEQKVAYDSRTLEVMVLGNDVSITLNPDYEYIRLDKRFLSSSYMAFIKKCLWEGFGFKSNTYDIRKRIKERTEQEPYWILSKNKEYVAQAHVQAMTALHGYIGGVCTPRVHRRKGYAKEIVRCACDYIMDQGRTPALAVSKTNKAALGLYYSMGFIKIGTTVVYMQERDFKGDENS